MSRKQYYDVLQCPWCGTYPLAEPWHGGGPRKTMISCVNDDCRVSPSACEPTIQKAVAAWNDRTKSPFEVFRKLTRI